MKLLTSCRKYQSLRQRGREREMERLSGQTNRQEFTVRVSMLMKTWAVDNVNDILWGGSPRPPAENLSPPMLNPNLRPCKEPLKRNQSSEEQMNAILPFCSDWFTETEKCLFMVSIDTSDTNNEIKVHPPSISWWVMPGNECKIVHYMPLQCRIWACKTWRWHSLSHMVSSSLPVDAQWI